MTRHKYEMIAQKNVIEMLKAVVGGELEGADLAKAAETYLTANGMAPEAVEALKANLK